MSDRDQIEVKSNRGRDVVPGDQRRDTVAQVLHVVVYLFTDASKQF